MNIISINAETNSANFTAQFLSGECMKALVNSICKKWKGIPRFNRFEFPKKISQTKKEIHQLRATLKQD